MSYYVEDSELAKRNKVLLKGDCGIAYNAVISTVFSDEDTSEPVTLQEAKDWCRIDISDDDTLVTELIKAARIVCEQYANLSFINRTVTAKIHNGLGNFNLPYGPVIGDVTSYTDMEGIELTDYNERDAYARDITVVYDAGYETLPENLKTAIKNQIAWMYDNRGDARLALGLSLESRLTLNQVRIV